MVSQHSNYKQPSHNKSRTLVTPWTYKRHPSPNPDRQTRGISYQVLQKKNMSGEIWRAHSFTSASWLLHIDGLVQEKQNSNADALELCLSWTNPSIYFTRGLSASSKLTCYKWLYNFKHTWCKCTSGKVKSIITKKRVITFIAKFLLFHEFWLIRGVESQNWSSLLAVIIYCLIDVLAEIEIPQSFTQSLIMKCKTNSISFHVLAIFHYIMTDITS